MVLPKKCFCSHDSYEPVSKTRTLKRKLMKSKDNKVPSVLVVRLENDTKAENYIVENNIKTDFEKFSSASKMFLDSLQEANENNSVKTFSNYSKFRIEEVSTVSNESFNSTVADGPIKRSNGVDSSNAISNLGPDGSVPVVKLQNCITENNLKTDSKSVGCSSAKINGKFSSKKVIKHSENHSAEFSDCSKLKILDISTTNSEFCGFIGFDNCPPLNIKTSDGIKSNIPISVLEPNRIDVSMAEKNLITDKEKDVCSDSLVHSDRKKISPRPASKKKVKPSPSSHKKIKPCPASRRKGKVEEKICQPVALESSLSLTSEVSESAEDEIIRPLKKDSNDNNVSVKIGLNQKVSPDIEEPLSLITKLTGCQIPPSKLKVLPLSSCISSLKNDNNDSIIELKDNSNNNSSYRDENIKSSKKVNSLNTHSIHSISFCFNGEKKLNVKRNECKDGSNVKPCSLEKVERTENDTRTVYDVMEYVSVVMPSWNIHILRDTNTFCICQVTRGKHGVPNISKCIELDDNFNGKVHIYEQHCKKFDGVYDSEDAVVTLIREVDRIP